MPRNQLHLPPASFLLVLLLEMVVVVVALPKKESNSLDSVWWERKRNRENRVGSRKPMSWVSILNSFTGFLIAEGKGRGVQKKLSGTKAYI